MNRLKLIILVFCVVLLCGCSNKKCVKSHQEFKLCMRPQCVYMGNNPVCTNYFYPCEQTICDEYEGEDDGNNKL